MSSFSSFDQDLSCGLLKSVKERREAFFSFMASLDPLAPLSDPTTRPPGSSMDSERDSDSCGGAALWSSPSTMKMQVQSQREETIMVHETAGTDISAGCSTSEVKKKKPEALSWLKKLAEKRRVVNKFLCFPGKTTSSKVAAQLVKVSVKKKKWKELSAVYVGQEFQAHKGAVRTAKFSPDGKYLATGGQDGVVRVWLVAFTDSHEKQLMGVEPQKLSRVPVVVPDRVFRIEEVPFQECYGHCGDILDLAWSKSNLIISSSSDCTVRLWNTGSNNCQGVYRHSKTVTCVQFNPIDEGYFMSGSIDGKIRSWAVLKGRVVDWDDARGAVTALSFQPDGQGLFVGCSNGCCRFYHTSGCSLQLITHIQLPQNNRSSRNRISGIQFCQDDSQRVIITFQDSKVQVFDKTELILEDQGKGRWGAQTSNSDTRKGRHNIVTVGEDSRVYLREYNQQERKTGGSKLGRACEYLTLEGVSAAVPWKGYGPYSGSCSSRARRRASARTIASAAWPEEMLQESCSVDCHLVRDCSRAWGLVLVTASSNGTITVLHNYGAFALRV